MPKPNIKQIVADVIEARKLEEFPGRERYPPCPRRIPQNELDMEGMSSAELVKLFYRTWKKSVNPDKMLNAFARF